MVPLVWGGCVAAVAGGVLMTSSRADGGAGGGLASGDLLLVAAAVMWSLQVPHPLGPPWDPSGTPGTSLLRTLLADPYDLQRWQCPERE